MNTLLANKANPDERVLDSPRPAIDPGVSAPSQVGSTVRIDGEICGQHDMFVDGEINGSIMLPEHTLTIGPKATVKANIRAQKVVLVGNMEGNIEAGERIEVRSCCSLLGDMRSPRIMIENGAYIKGAIEVIRQAPAYPVTQPSIGTI